MKSNYSKTNRDKFRKFLWADVVCLVERSVLMDSITYDRISKFDKGSSIYLLVNKTSRILMKIKYSSNLDLWLDLTATLDEVDDDLEVIEEGARTVFESHTSLLEKGFALSQPPTIYQALEGNLPLRWQSNEHSFLKDFVLCAPGTSGGRLARYDFNFQFRMSSPQADK